MAEQVPSIGRVVHVVIENGRHVPADVCSIWDDGTLVLFIKDHVAQLAYFGHNVPYSEEPKPHTWHWPEYVPAKG